MWKRPKWFLKDPAPFRRNYPICYQVPEGGSTSLETGYISRAVVYSLSLIYTILRLQHLISLVSVKCLPVCVNKVHCFTVKWLCLIWFSKYVPPQYLIVLWQHFLITYFFIIGVRRKLSSGHQNYNGALQNLK